MADREHQRCASVRRSRLRKEILSQPDVLSRILQRERPRVDIAARIIHRFDPRILLVVARGSADNAGLYGKYLFGIFNGKIVALATPSIITRYGKIPDMSRALVLAISQSGQSHDVVETTEAARRAGALTIAVTNAPRSPLAAVAQEVLLCHAGPERSVAASKTYTAQLMLLALLSAAMASDRRRLSDLEALPGKVALALQLEPRAAEVAERLRYLEHCAVIGRGFCYGTAFEVALKLAELTYLVAQPYSAADFRHGPIAVVDRGFCVLLIAPRGRVHQDMIELMGQLNSRGAEVIAISNSRSILRQAQCCLPLPARVPEWLAPLVSVIPGQLLAMHLAQVKGFSLDTPRYLKKVTRTL